MNRKKIYNPESTENVNDRKIFGGDPTGIFELNNIKYQWAYNLWEVMLNNTWFPKEVDMTKDIQDYKNLTEDEKTEFNTLMKSNDPIAMRWALKGLKASYLENTPGEVRTIHGTTPNSAPGVKPYASFDEYVDDIKKPEYKKDPKFRALVDKRLEISDI